MIFVGNKARHASVTGYFVILQTSLGQILQFLSFSFLPLLFWNSFSQSFFKINSFLANLNQLLYWHFIWGNNYIFQNSCIFCHVLKWTLSKISNKKIIIMYRTYEDLKNRNYVILFLIYNLKHSFKYSGVSLSGIPDNETPNIVFC